MLIWFYISDDWCCVSVWNFNLKILWFTFVFWWLFLWKDFHYLLFLEFARSFQIFSLYLCLVVFPYFRKIFHFCFILSSFLRNQSIKPSINMTTLTFLPFKWLTEPIVTIQLSLFNLHNLHFHCCGLNVSVVQNMARSSKSGDCHPCHSQLPFSSAIPFCK